MTSFQWANGATSESLTPTFILPQDKRPSLSEVAPFASIPIIDMSVDDAILIDKIAEASKEFGFFQIINHGVPSALCDEMLNAIANLFELPAKEKAQFAQNQIKNGRMYSYFLKDEEASSGKVSMWSETFAYFWNPYNDDFLSVLPTNPPKFKEVKAVYAKKVGIVMDRLLRLLSKGLGLEEEYLQKRLGTNPTYKAHANYYPPCPDPEKTLGLSVHTDVPLLTLVLPSEVQGLQIIKDGKWMSVHCVPNAFAINIGDQLEVLSNGMYKSVNHRVVTNKTHKRISLAMIYGPDEEAVVGPAKELVDGEHPALYRDYLFGEFMEEFFKQEGRRRFVKEIFMLNAPVM